MKGILSRAISVAAFAIPALWAIAAVVILCAVAAARNRPPHTQSNDDDAKQVFYTTSDSTGAAEIWAIEVSRGKITTKDIGPTNGGDCVSLALSPVTRILYSMCGSLFGAQYLATIDLRTGLASQVGVPNIRPRGNGHDVWP